MCLVERYTFRRGRSAVPATFTRMRLWTLRRLSFFEICGIIFFSFPALARFPHLRCKAGVFKSAQLFGAGLADLLLQALANVAHTFVLVRIRWTQRTHFRGGLA